MNCPSGALDPFLLEDPMPRQFAISHNKLIQYNDNGIKNKTKFRKYFVITYIIKQPFAWLQEDLEEVLPPISKAAYNQLGVRRRISNPFVEGLNSIVEGPHLLPHVTQGICVR